MTTHLITMPVESVLRGKYPLTLATVELRGPAVTKTWLVATTQKHGWWQQNKNNYSAENKDRGIYATCRVNVHIFIGPTVTKNVFPCHLI